MVTRMTTREACVAVVMTALVVVLGISCGGGDDRPDISVATDEVQPPATTPPESTAATTVTERSSTPAPTTSTDLSERVKAEIASQAASAGTAIGRWDEELAACSGPSAAAGDRGATCVHEAWQRLVFQVEVSLYYLRGHLRDTRSGRCHDALAREADTLRGFWYGAAPLDLSWLDEQQRPPSRLDIESAVDLLRPVPARIREDVATACAR